MFFILRNKTVIDLNCGRNMHLDLLDLDLSITNGLVSSKIYEKQMDLNVERVNFPFLDADVPRSPSYIHFATYLFC